MLLIPVTWQTADSGKLTHENQRLPWISTMPIFNHFGKKKYTFLQKTQNVYICFYTHNCVSFMDALKVVARRHHVQNTVASFNQTWHTASMSQGTSCFFRWRASPFFKGRYLRNTLKKFKTLLKNYWENFNQIWHKTSLDEGDSSLFKWRTMHQIQNSRRYTFCIFSMIYIHI